MAAAEALSVPGEGSTITPEPTATAGIAAESGQSTALQRWPHLIPIAQLVAVILGVFAIIWNQQQTIDGLRAEFRSELRSEIGGVRTEMGELRAEMGELRAEMGELRAEVSENGQRLARIEGFLGIGMPDEVPQ